MRAAASTLFLRPFEVGSRLFPPPGIVGLAAIGAGLLVIIVALEWQHPNDETAYWLAASRLWAGLPLYDPTAAPGTPFAYWYPPPLAQVLAPFTPYLAGEWFSVLWTALLLGCLWWLGGRNPLVALALIAFIPVAVELRVRNVHLLLAVLAVLALRRSWAFWIPAAAIKMTPVLGGVYLAAAGRWRDAVKLGVVGLVVLGVSYVVSPEAWREFFEVVGLRADTAGGSIVPVHYSVRLGAGALLAIVAGRLATRDTSRVWGEMLLIVALTIANPTFWVTALSMLIAVVPLWRERVRAPSAVAVASAPLASAAAVQGEVTTA